MVMVERIGTHGKWQIQRIRPTSVVRQYRSRRTDVFAEVDIMKWPSRLVMLALAVGAFDPETVLPADGPKDAILPAQHELLSVSEGVGFNDEPAMAQTQDGGIYVAWNGFRNGADSLQLARFQREGKEFKPLGTWQIVGGKGTYVVDVCAVSAGRSVVVLYAAENDKNWDVFAVSCGPEGPGQPTRVTSDPGVDIKPSAIWHDGTLWIAWESNRNGPRQVFAASVRDGSVSESKLVSESESSSYAPSVAALASGDICVAWHSFHQGNYDVYLRHRAANGSWSAPARLTRAPSVDRHAILVTRDDQLWIIYENAQIGDHDRIGDQFGEYRVTKTNQRRLIVAKVTPQGLMAPKDYRRTSPLYDHCEAPSAAFDDIGRLWVTFAKPQIRGGAGWEVYITCYDGRRWRQAARVSNHKGMDRRPCLAVDGGQAIVAFQVDNIKRVWWRTMQQALAATSNIMLAALEVDSPPPNSDFELEPLVEPEEPFLAGRIRAARGEDSSTPTISCKGQTLKLFYGNLHEHSDISVCQRIHDQSVDESYQNMRDITALDFACVTDHGFNMNPYYWSYTGKLARMNHDPGRFLTFLGEEWTSTFEQYNEKHPYGFYGHRNLVFADPYFPKWFNAQTRQTPAQLWEELRKMNADFVQIPHQLADTGNVPTDWNFTDEKAQPVAEIFQVRGSYEYKGAPREAVRITPKAGYFIHDAWARGIVIGVIASPDHGGGYGKACVFAPELTREAILDAIRARRCYGTTAAKIFLDVRVNGHLMGEKLKEPATGPVEVKIATRCPADIERIEVCRNNQFVYTVSPNGRQADLTYVDMEPPDGRSYYYVRLIQKDGEIAWTSPVWFGAE